MTAVITLPNQRETVVAQISPEYHHLPEGFDFFPECPPPEPIQELVDKYNRWFMNGGEKAIYKRQPEVKREHGLSYAQHGGTSKVLIVVHNPFSTGLHGQELLAGQFLRDGIEAMGIVDEDGVTPQVVQFASPCRDADIPLTPKQHLQVASGHLEPIADKVAQVVCEKFPDAEQVIGLGYSLSGFLTPDILLSLSKDKNVLAGLIANPPGAQAEHMRTILGKFSHAGANMSEHLLHSGLRILEPKNIVGLAAKVCERAGVIADVVWRPTNMSLWLAFSRGQLLERVKTLHQRVPRALIAIAYGVEDPLCNPKVLEAFLASSSDYSGVVVEHGDHAWGRDLPRSMGHLATSQIGAILAPKQPPIDQIALAA